MEDLIREDNIGVVKISDEVVSVIAGIAAQEIDGILDGQMGVASNLTNIFNGKKIMDVVAQVQDNVKKTVEAMTGLYVEAVNIYVQNVYLPKKEESESI
nr:Asp23/Gls24 family envelope stress response protein [Clostridium chromiireducens]